MYILDSRECNFVVSLLCGIRKGSFESESLGIDRKVKDG